MFTELKDKYFRKRGQKLLAAGKPVQAQKFLRRSYEINASAENMFNLALSYMARFNYSEAEDYLRKIYTLLPDNEINILALLEALLLQRKWLKLEKLISENKGTLSGSSSFNKYAVLALDPVEREKYVTAKEKYNNGFLEIEKGNRQEALKLLQSALDYFGENSDLLRNIGLLYVEESDYQSAFKFFEKALSQAPGDQQLQKLLIKAKKMLQKQTDHI